MRAHAELSRSPLSPAGLRRALVRPDGLITEVRVVGETGSTNADLAAAAQDGAAEGLVLVAEAQSAGRGRLDRVWLAPPRAALTLSVLLRPTVPAVRLGWLPLLAGVALVEAVGPHAPAALKWPNDLLVRTADGDRKCGGILAEAVPGAVVIGIGLNVAQRADELPDPIDPAAVGPTSLGLAGASVDRGELLISLLSAFSHWYGRWHAVAGDPAACGLMTAYRSACLTLGRHVTVRLPGGASIQGHADDIDGDGRLLVATAEGVRALAAGDVHHVR
jgi:BirA family transcriptional regulator, biotin operon repressor / biotin---[acetyl-CoA-carboxylase] ligase